MIFRTHASRHDAEGGRFNRPGPYRSRHGMIFGVCRGLAEYFDLSVTGVRLAFLVLALFTSIGPMVIGYLLAALLLRVEPVIPLGTDAEEEFYNSYTASRHMALLRLKRVYDNLDRRIQRLESTVTSRDYRWEQRIKTGD